MWNKVCYIKTKIIYVIFFVQKNLSCDVYCKRGSLYSLTWVRCFQGCSNCSDVIVIFTYNNVQVIKSIDIPVLLSFVLKTCFKTAAVNGTWRDISVSTVILFQLNIKKLCNPFGHKPEMQIIQMWGFKCEMLQ